MDQSMDKTALKLFDAKYIPVLGTCLLIVMN